jgi:MFS family permease
MVVATALHPSRETTATILEAEVRLVAAHALFTLSILLVLLGLPGLSGAASARMGRLGLVGFLLAFLGTMLIAVSGNFGFLAPVLAAQSPATIDAINRYPPEAALNAAAFGGFVVGLVIFGMAMAKTASFPRGAGRLVAVGAPCQVFGFALAQLVAPGLWVIAILRSPASVRGQGMRSNALTGMPPGGGYDSSQTSCWSRARDTGHGDWVVGSQGNPGRCPSAGPGAGVSLPERPGHRLDLP